MKNRKILIIDDDQYIRLLLQYLLERSYDIEVRANGQEALMYLQEGNIPDMIISDLDMPVMTGNVFLDNIKHFMNLFVLGMLHQGLAVPESILYGFAHHALRDQQIQGIPPDFEVIQILFYDFEILLKRFIRLAKFFQALDHLEQRPKKTADQPPAHPR